MNLLRDAWGFLKFVADQKLWRLPLAFLLFPFMFIGNILVALFPRLNPRSDIALDGDLYMRRWRFGAEWMPGFRVHNLVRSDKDRELHDHPFDFVSIILKGGYFEWTPTADGGQQRKWYGPGSVIRRRAEDLHRIELNRRPTLFEQSGVYVAGSGGEDIPAWTLVFRSRHRREWGFMTPAGWVHWKQFVAAHNNTIVQHDRLKEKTDAPKQAFNDDDIPF